MPAKRTTKEAKRTASDPVLMELLRAHGFLVEDMRAQNTAVLEAMTSFREEVRRDLAALRAELLERIERLEDAVRQNSRDIRRLEGRVESLEGKVDRLEGKVDRLEGRVDRLETEVTRLSAEIRAVREALGEKCDAASLAALELRVVALERVVLSR
jgi:predicted nuclease with TOPRIM domain